MSPSIPAPVADTRGTLELGRLLAGRQLVVLGGSGFLGKVWWTLLLARFPEVDRIHLVLRTRDGQTAEQRFWDDLAGSECLAPLREQHGERFDAFLREKIVPVAGDVVRPFCGLSQDVRDALRGQVAAVVNVAGVVEFDPPLDVALEVNAFGVQNLVALARDLGGCGVVHTSTCFVAGSQTGFVEEIDPREHPFPRASELERAHWDPHREIAECLDIIEQAKHRANDAFRQSRFLDDAKRNLRDANEPGHGAALEEEVERVRRKFVEAQLADLGMERARFWGWANTYTYTKSIGEQIAVASGLPVTIVRPAIVESSVRFPFPGWIEGINTSAPLIYAIREGQAQIPGSEHILDFIPVDMVASGILLALGEVLDGTHRPVYQFASGDVNPCSMARLFELSGLYKRKYWKKTQRDGPIISALQAHVEGAIFSTEQFERVGPKAVARGAKLLSKALRSASVGPAAPLLVPTAKKLEKFGRTQEKIHSLLMQFAPFTAEFDYVFRCDNTRAAFARLRDGERDDLVWEPEKIDWREWFLDVHCPGLEKRVFPELEEKLKRKVSAPRHHETLASLLDEMVIRFDLGVALQRTETDGLSRISYRQWGELSAACAGRLQRRGIRHGDRVMLAGENHPAWPISFFGIIKAGATVVPLESGIEPDVARRLAEASGAKILVADKKVAARLAGSLPDGVEVLGMLEVAAKGEPGTPVTVSPGDIAALIYTSGTTGNPKGVMLSHHNLTNLIASLAPLFPLGRGDRVLSVLPLHHTFELTCGMLLPLSRGTRIIYLDELNAERLEHGLKQGRVTAMVGVPALWELLERKVLQKVADRGPLASRVFDFAVELNRNLGKTLGVDAGQLLFGAVHEGLGGHLRLLVSGGAALPESTHQLFSGVGLHLAEGYGLTEASPVLSVSRAGPRERAGHVGKAIPGVEVKIFDPDEEGVGEVIARGPNVMVGYSDDAEATRQAIDADGWLHTGDLGRIDRKGNLRLVGRAKDTIVSSSGENVYPDDVEARLGKLEHVEELAIFGVSDGRGGERVACLAVVDQSSAPTLVERKRLAKKSLDEAFAKLPSVMRPTITAITDEELPRTVTKKVKRKELEEIVQRVSPASVRPMELETRGTDDAAASMVRRAVATISRRSPGSLSPTLSLRGDLGFDSLMLLELLVSLETQAQKTVDAERLNRCETVGDAMDIVREAIGAAASSRVAVETYDEPEASIELPPALREAAMAWMGRAQHSFYSRLMRTKVTGRAFIPYNRNTLVVANHASHLDMGLVKYGLGSYGDNLVALAAQDYFFEGKWRKAYFENFTNLVALSRSGSLRQSLRQAGDLLEEGRTVLVFPEGTRSRDGVMREFKPISAHLALQHDVDILPVWLEGTSAALPKGGTVVRRRELEVRIGPPIVIADLRRKLEGATASELTRAVSRIAEQAVRDLSQGKVLDLNTLDVSPYIPKNAPSPAAPKSMAGIIEDLEGRFRKGSVKGSHWFYFALGDKERWSLELTPESCRFERGKAVATADCVLKTSPEMFQRIVLEAYTPTTSEFFNGIVKTNNPKLLKAFQRAFDLSGGA